MQFEIQSLGRDILTLLFIYFKTTSIIAKAQSTKSAPVKHLSIMGVVIMSHNMIIF